jgi:hypothetical protein
MSQPSLADRQPISLSLVVVGSIVTVLLLAAAWLCVKASVPAAAKSSPLDSVAAPARQAARPTRQAAAPTVNRMPPEVQAAFQAGHLLGKIRRASGLSKLTDRELDSPAVTVVRELNVPPHLAGEAVKKFKNGFGWGFSGF